MGTGQVHIGTSGWIYRHWRGTVYPEKLRQAEWLSFLASELDSIEVNSTFYRIPKPQMIARWNELAPQGFEFALKMWRGITHYSKLKNAGKNVAKFLDVVNALQPQIRGPMLIQLPPNQGIDIRKLDDFLHDWEETADSRWRLAAEFRNDSWLVPETLAVLDHHGAALCLHDMGGKGAASEPNTRVPFVYVRRHGPGDARYSGSYTQEQLGADAKHIREWTAAGREVYIYFNNDIGGHAYTNALALKRLLRTVEETGDTGLSEIPIRDDGVGK